MNCNSYGEFEVFLLAAIGDPVLDWTCRASFAGGRRKVGGLVFGFLTQ
jgi:hypothetical protein